MLRHMADRARPGLVALYDIRPGNGVGQFLQPRSPHGAPIRAISGRRDCEGISMRKQDTFNNYLNVGTVITFWVDSSCAV